MLRLNLRNCNNGEIAAKSPTKKAKGVPRKEKLSGKVQPRLQQQLPEQAVVSRPAHPLKLQGPRRW